MYFFDDNYDYFGTYKSKADKIVNEAKEKLLQLVSKEVEATLEEKKDKEISELTEKYAEEKIALKEKIAVLEAEVNNLKEEAKRQDNLVPKMPFVPGDLVYFLVQDKQYAISCPNCSGKGTVIVNTKEYGDLKISCPVCKGWGDRKQTPYFSYKVNKGYIVKVDFSKELGSDKYNFNYYIDYTSNKKPTKFTESCWDYHKQEKQVFKTLKEAEEARELANKESKEKAENVYKEATD